MIKSYFTSAWRSLLHNRRMTALNITGLSVGMAASVLIFLWVQNELSRAKRKQKAIFHLLLEGKEPWLSVESTQYLDVTNGHLPPRAFYELLAKSISRRASSTPSGSHTD